MAWRKPFSNQGGYSRELPPEDVLDARRGTLFVAGTSGLQRHEDVASYNSNASSLTGTIKVTLPFSWTSTMMNVRIAGFNYVNGASWEILVGGYNPSASSSWTRITASVVSGRPPFSQVRLAHDGVNCCILLGDTATAHAYPKVVVKEFIGGYQGMLNDWANGWVVDVITNESSITTSLTISGLIGTSSQYRRGDDTWQDLAAAVRAVTLAGLSFAVSTAIAAGDSILVALGKLQAQVDGKAAAGNNSDITNLNTLATAAWGSNGRIYGDFSNATHNNRTLLQTATANSATSIGAIPSGSGNTSNFTAWNSSDASIGSYAQMGVVSTFDVRFQSGATGTGAWLPMTFWTNGLERMRVLVNGRILMGRTTETDGFSNGLTVSGAIASDNGYRCQAGPGGAHGNLFNINWSGSAAQLWIDASNIGTINVTSDHRIKQDIVPLEADFISRVCTYEVVEYRLQDFGIWRESGQVYQGLIAHQAQKANPKAATGSKDAVDEDGQPVIQSLEVIPIITDCIGAIQQMAAEITALRTELDELKAR